MDELIAGEAGLRGPVFFGALALLVLWEAAAPRRILNRPLARRWFGNAAIAIIDTAIDDLWDIDRDSPTWNGQFYVPDFFLPSEAPSALAWADDDSAVYAGYLTGPQGSSIEGNGTVRKCVIGEDACRHAVAVRAPVRSIAAVGVGAARAVYVADSSGWITSIGDAPFEPGPETSATDSQGLFDGTGGCVEDFGGYLRARPCDPAGCLLATGNLGDLVACEAAAEAGAQGLQASTLLAY